MKKIEGYFAQDFSIADAKLKINELVEINGRVYRYGKTGDVHVLDPVEKEQCSTNG
jgi:hypothetical protein